MHAAHRLLALLLAAPLAAHAAPPLPKHWAGAATVHGQSVPVRLTLTPGPRGTVSGSFENGKEISTSSSGSLTGNHLLLHFNYYARQLDATLDNGVLHGSFGSEPHAGDAHASASVPLELRPEATGKPATHFAAAPAAQAGHDPGHDPIGGDWEIAVQSPKGESAWTLRVSPFGGNGEIQAVILRIDGDTGGLYGGYDAAQQEYRVGHFGASGAALYSLKPQPDGTLRVTNLLRDNQSWPARRPADARRENLPPPTRTDEQSGVVDPSQPLAFSAKNLAGETVSSTDPQFRGKVLLVTIGGSWCPNCHDEAPFLVELYNRFHAEGLEVVNLSFEEDEQLANPERLRAFVTRYHIPYTVLLAGTPEQLAEKLPQGKHVNCWPTTFFVGRDGLVKATHAGFAGPATGQAHTELKAETTALIERLLAGKATSAAASAEPSRLSPGRGSSE